MDIDDTDSIALFVNEAKEMGIKINLPCVLKSESIFTIKDNSIEYGLSALKAVGHGIMNEMQQIRENCKGFENIVDFCQKVGPKIANKRALESLAKSGAFDKIHNNRNQIVQSTEILVSLASSEKKQKDSGLENLFGENEERDASKGNSSLQLLARVNEYSDVDKLTAEFEAFGFYISSHPLEKYNDDLKKIDVVWSNDLDKLGIVGKDREKVIKMAGVVTIVKQRSGKKGRFAFVHIADLYKVFECTIFNSDLISAKRDLLKEGRVVGLLVSVQRFSEDETARLNIKDIFSIEDFLVSKIDVDSSKSNSKEKNFTKQNFNNKNEERNTNSANSANFLVRNNSISNDNVIIKTKKEKEIKIEKDYKIDLETGEVINNINKNEGYDCLEEKENFKQKINKLKAKYNNLYDFSNLSFEKINSILSDLKNGVYVDLSEFELSKICKNNELYFLYKNKIFFCDLKK
jgi:DNA polymerase III alpha subunit